MRATILVLFTSLMGCSGGSGPDGSDYFRATLVVDGAAPIEIETSALSSESDGTYGCESRPLDQGYGLGIGLSTEQITDIGEYSGSLDSDGAFLVVIRMTDTGFNAGSVE